MKHSPIRFKFTCSAFGKHYFDVITPSETFEIMCSGFIESCPAIELHWTGEITPEILAAWEVYCRAKLLAYEDWKKRNAKLLA